MSRPITPSGVIEKAKETFFKEIRAGIDMNALNEILLEEYDITVDDDLEFKEGSIISSNGQILYELEYEITLSLLVQLDSEGNPESVQMEVCRDKTAEPPNDPIETAQDWSEEMDEKEIVEV